MTWNDLFKQCDENRSVLDRLGSNGPAVTCKPTFIIMPLRYAAVAGSAEQLKLLPTLPANLQRPQQVGKLTESAYAVRPLREGFLYLLVKRGGVYNWEGNFRVDTFGVLSYVSADNPWEPFKPSFNERLPQPYHSVALSDIDGIDELRVLFSADPLTPAMLDRYVKLPNYRNTLQRFDIRQLAYSCVSAPDSVLTHDQLDLVADAAAGKTPALLELLGAQPFPRVQVPMAAIRANMAPAPGHITDRGVALVLDDALGITQELNDWRNHSMQTLEDYLQRSNADDEKGMNNHRRLTIALAINTLKKTMIEQEVLQNLDAESQVKVTYTDVDGNGNAQTDATSAGKKRYRPYRSYRTYRNADEQAAKVNSRVDQRKHDCWDGKYAKHVDNDRLQAFLDEYQKVLDEANATKEARAADHLAWLTSQRLQDALMAYDRHNTDQGIFFESQLGKAMVGMNACTKGDWLLSGWVGDPVAPTNLVWRALAQNQEATEEEIAKILAERHRIVNMSESQMGDTLKNLAAIYDKSHAAVEAFEELGKTGRGPGVNRLSGSVFLTNVLGNQLFENKAASRLLDSPLNVTLVWTFKAMLGRFAKQMHLEARDGKPLGQGATRRVDNATAREFNQAMIAGAKGPMAGLRIASVLTLLEAWNVKVKAQKEDKGSREYLELTSAFMSLGAAGSELGAAAVGLAEKSPSSSVQRAASVFKGGLRLGAGILAGISALVGAGLDLNDMADAYGNKKGSLAFVYGVRAMAQISSGAFTFGLGLAYGAPFLRFVAQKYSQSKFWGFVAEQAATLAVEEVELFMLRWCFRINIAIFVLSIVLDLMLPDDLEAYLSHSTFRKDRSNKLVDSEDKEAEIFVRAVRGTL